MCDVPLIARKSFVLRVNKVTSFHQTHDRQSAARVPTGVLKLAFMEHTSQRLFITYVCFFFDRGTWASGAPSPNGQHLFFDGDVART